MNIIYLSLGTNLGDKTLNLHQALSLISIEIGSVINKSNIYETSAWGVLDQDNYLNQIIQIHTNLSSRKVLNKILEIEIQMGRIRNQKWESRVIDIDLLFYNGEIINEIDLKVPHPHLHERNFILVPLSEISPNMKHPKFDVTILTLLSRCKDKGTVIKKDVNGF